MGDLSFMHNTYSSKIKNFKLYLVALFDLLIENSIADDGAIFKLILFVLQFM